MRIHDAWLSLFSLGHSTVLPCMRWISLSPFHPRAQARFDFCHRLYTLQYILLIYVNERVMRTLYRFQIVYRYSYTQRERQRERERETHTHTGLLIGKILSTPSRAYLPATQSVHLEALEAPVVQAQRQTARSSRAFEIQKDAHSCVYTMHSSLCSPEGTALSCRTHAMDISQSIPSKGPSQIRHVYTWERFTPSCLHP